MICLNLGGNFPFVPKRNVHFLGQLVKSLFTDYVVKNTLKTLYTKKNKFSQIIIATEPLDLRSGIPVNNIAFFVLEVPRDHNEDVPLADPDLLLYLTLDPAHPGHPVKAADPDMVCAHHEFGTAKHLTVPFLGQFDPDYLVARRCSRFMVCQYNLSFLVNGTFLSAYWLA